MDKKLSCEDQNFCREVDPGRDRRHVDTSLDDQISLSSSEPHTLDPDLDQI